MDDIEDLLKEIERTSDGKSTRNSQAYKNLVDLKTTERVGFYGRFYVYLSRIPPPKASYAGNNEAFPALQTDDIVLVDANEAQISNSQNEQLAAANAQLARVQYISRLKPWNEYFCRHLKSLPLCVSDKDLYELMGENIATIDDRYRNFVFRITPMIVIKKSRNDDDGPPHGPESKH